MSKIETVTETLKWVEEGYSDKTALIDYMEPKRRYTYGEAIDKMRAFSGFLRKEVQMEKGDRICYIADSSADHFVSFFAPMKFGGIPSSLAPMESPDRIKWMINHVEPKALVYHNKHIDLVKKIKEDISSVDAYISLDEAENFSDEYKYDKMVEEYKGAEDPDVKVKGEDPAFINFTSGSTGKPKPITHSHIGARWIIENWDIEQYDRTLWPFGTNFIAWWWVVPTILHNGASCVFLKEFSPKLYLSAVQDEDITFIGSVASLWPALLNEYKQNKEKYDLSSVSKAITGSASTPKPVLKEVGEVFTPNIKDTYVATEMMCTKGYPLNDPKMDLGSSGKPFSNAQFEIRDVETGEEVIEESEEEGEIYVKCPMTETATIWNDSPVKTNEVFKDGWWKSDDVGYVDEEGYLWVTGRTDLMFKSGGIKVHAENVEDLLSAHPSVEDVCVVPIPSEEWGKVGKAFIETKNEVLSGEDMESWWKEQEYPGYNRPREWVFMKELPRLSSGKLDRESIAEKA